MRCDQCRFWKDDEESWEPAAIGFKRCEAMRERWRIQDEASERRSGDFAEVRKTALKNARAYVEDGSEYKAYLFTAPDFFCALFSKRD